jgi:hypothetical protein
MPYSTQNFQPLSLAQVSPLGYAIQQGVQGIGQGVDLYKNILAAQIEKIKKQYAPVTMQADAASKLAYANLMGPQFLAKLMGNPDLLANLPEDQKNQLLPFLVHSGSGQGFNNPAMPNAVQQHNPNNKNTINSQNNRNYDPITTIPTVNNRPTNNIVLSPRDQQGVDNLQPGGSYTIQDQPQSQPQPAVSYNPPVGNKTFAENAGEYAGVKEEGKEAGKLRADDLADLGKQYEAELNLSDKYNGVHDLINNDVFRNMRARIPGFQGMQLNVLKNYGTREEKELIGKFENTANEILKDTISTFPAGKILKGEVDIGKNMKINKSDPMEVIIGKIGSAETYHQLKLQRQKMTADIMRQYHYDKAKAEDLANKNLNSQAIINGINKKLDYSIQIRNKKTGQIETVPVSEARRRGVPNV